MFLCPSCNYKTEKINSLRIHAQKAHKLSSEAIYLAAVVKHKQPTCACGCMSKTKFHGITKGYSKFCPGHQARIKNNWGHNENAQKKSQASRREMLKSGEMIVWNKGITKHDDERLRIAGRSVAKTWTTEKREKYSKIMSKNRLAGIIPSLTGSEHPQWKGGTSTIGALCHSNNRLYSEWKFPKLAAAKFKCERCSSTTKLHIHHDKEKMAAIIKKFRSDVDCHVLTPEQNRIIVEKVIDYHTSQNVSGIVLCKICHGHEHPSLNFDN
jgi:hypothetical protein